MVFTTHKFACFRALSIVLLVGLSSSCNQLGGHVAQPTCQFGEVMFSSDFPGGRIDDCHEVGPESYVLDLIPEDYPINHSPWYAFKVHAATSRDITISLNYTKKQHRYRPKISSDGKSWQRLDDSYVTISGDGTRADLELSVGPTETWISAQEIVSSADTLAWMQELATQPHLELSTLGLSTEGRNIYQIETQANGARQYILLVGRQHPPEVTGALAMRPFMERLFESDSLAREFRKHYGVIAVPLLNPDGVFHGNWRHNVRGVDLNRDWGPFTQVETSLVRDRLTEIEEADSPELALFLDFHSTAKTVFYSIEDQSAVSWPGFIGEYMAAVQAGAADLQNNETIHWQPGSNTEQPNSKTYFHLTHKIPSMTYEIGDTTDRGFINSYGRMSAEKLMVLMLEEPYVK
jgi:predicted deacylase